MVTPSTAAACIPWVRITPINTVKQMPNVHVAAVYSSDTKRLKRPSSPRWSTMVTSADPVARGNVTLLISAVMDPAAATTAG